MNTFFETYKPFDGGPTLVRVVKPFVANDFDFGEVRYGGATTAEQTFSAGKRYGGTRYVECSRPVDPTPETLRAMVDDLQALWKESTDRMGKERKLRWLDGGTFHSRTAPGFDGTFADWTAYGISSRIELESKSRKHETRQLEIDAMRERARQQVEGAVPMADWVEAYNQQWREFADYTAQKLIEFVAELVVDVRVKQDWLDEAQDAETSARISKMSDEIDSIDEQLKVLRERKRMLRQRIYDKDRATLERSLIATQDPVLSALFKAAIESVADKKSQNISHPLFD